MAEAQGTFSEAGSDAYGRAGTRDDRLPVPQAAALIVALSVGMWALIALGVGWVFG